MIAPSSDWAFVLGGGTGACRTVEADGELESLGDGVKEVDGPTAALEGGGTEDEADKGALWDPGQGASRRL